MRLVEGEDYYETDPSAMAERLLALDQLLQKPHPAKGIGLGGQTELAVPGPLVYLFIDDLDAVPPRRRSSSDCPTARLRRRR